MQQSKTQQQPPVPNDGKKPCPKKDASSPGSSNEIPSDYFDRDANVLRAELDVMSTPQSSQYREAAYYTIKNVQSQCYTDYTSYCRPESQVMNFDEFLSQILSQRRALDEVKVELKDGVPEVHAHPIMSVLRPIKDTYNLYSSNGPMGPMSKVARPEIGRVSMRPVPQSGAASMQNTARGSSVLGAEAGPQMGAAAVESNTVSGVPHVKVPAAPAVPFTLPGQGGAPVASLHGLPPLPLHLQHHASITMGSLRGPVALNKPALAVATPDAATLTRRRALWGHGHHHSDSDSGEDEDKAKKGRKGSDSDSDEDEDGRRHHGWHHSQEPAEDTTFMGSLGFGPSGDVCLYQNYNKLSTGCQQAVVNVHMLRAQYWEEEQSAAHNSDCPLKAILFCLLGFMILSGCIRRCVHRKRFQQVHKIMSAIEGNASLKAAVEAEAGVPLPPMPHHCRGKSLAGKCCRAIVTTVTILATSFLVALTSLIITSHIVMGMVTYDETGNVASAPAPQAALAILLLVTIMQVTGLFLVVRGVRMVCGARHHGHHHGHSSEVEAVASAPAEPSAPPASGPSGPRGLSYVYNSFLGRFTAGHTEAAASNGDYTLLPSDALDQTCHGMRGAEMVSVAPTVVTQSAAAPGAHHSHVTYTAYTGVPVSGSTVFVPVSAAPVSHVSMI